MDNDNLGFHKRKHRFSVSCRHKDRRDSSSPKHRNSFSRERKSSYHFKANAQPISLIFKDEPLTLELLQSIKLLKEINIKKINPQKTDDNNETKIKYLINNIVKLIKSNRGLYNFFAYNKIDDKILYRLAPIIQFQQKEKDSYIWEENDNSTKVYYLLKGKISFRKNMGGFQDKEKFILNENNIFGMLDIIYERKRKLSCICLTDCSYLYFEKDFFKKYLEERVNKIETERKSFLVKFFNTYITIPLIKLERFISNHAEMLFFGKNEIIYQEGDANKCLYIIFIGEANLMKNINKGEFFVLSKFNQSIERLKERAKNIDYISIIKNDENNNNNEIEENINHNNLDFTLNKSNYKIISTLSKGSLGGLEISTGMTKFKYDLISNSSFCAVIKIKLEYLEDEHLKTLMINLLPVFIQTEKKIHLQIKKIKYIDHNIIPPSCQKYKDISNLINNNSSIENNKQISNIKTNDINNNNNMLNNMLIKNTDKNNIHNINNLANNNIINSNNNNIINQNYINISINGNENDKTYKKIIQKIDDKFDTNEGGFIKMNNFNMNLCKQKYFLKEQLKDSRRRDIKIFNFIKKYRKECSNDLKCSAVKMNYLLSDESKKNNYFELILSKNKYNNKNKKKNNSKSEFKIWHFPSPRKKSHLNINTNFFNFLIKNKKNKHKKIQSAKITKRQYQKRLNEIFEDYYNKTYLRKDYSKKEDTEDHKLVSIQLLREDGWQKYKKMNIINSGDDFIKELIVLKGKKYKDEGTNTYDVSDRNNNIDTMSTYYNDKKCMTQFNSINEFNKTLSNNENNQYEEKVIKIVNNKYIRDLFYKNSENNLNINVNRKNNKFRNARKNLFNEIQNENKNYKYQKNRMILYDTGHFDMPLASKLLKMK